MFKKCVITQFHVHNYHAEADCKRKALSRSPAMSRKRSNSPEFREASPPSEPRQQSNSSESGNSLPARSSKRPKPSCHGASFSRTLLRRNDNSDTERKLESESIVSDLPHICVQGLAVPQTPHVPWEKERRGCRFLEGDLQRSSCDGVRPAPMTPEGLLTQMFTLA